MNMPATVSTLTREIGALTERLAPAPRDLIAEAVDAMKRGGMMIPKGIAPADLLTEYSAALSSVPACGLIAAVSKIKRGEYEIDHAFMPRPAELAAMARMEARTVREDLARKRDTFETMTKAPTAPDRSPAVMERVRARLDQFRQEHVAAKASAGGFVAPEPMTPERAAYWESIAALADAPNVTAEQMAFRRKIEKQIGDA